MSITIEIHSDYTELYGISAAGLTQPRCGESVSEYAKRASLGKEEDMLIIVGGRSKPMSYRFKDGDVVKIYPLAASG